MYTNITVTISQSFSFNYGAILTAHADGYILMLAHCAITQDDVDGIVSMCQNESCQHDESQHTISHAPSIFYAYMSQETINALTNNSRAKAS